MRVLLLLLLCLAPPAAADWQGLRWGMTAGEVTAQAGPGVTPVIPPRRYGGGLSAPLMQRGIDIGGVTFTAWFQMAEGRLVQVLFDRRARASPAAHAALIAHLSTRRGRPDRVCRAGDAVEAVWSAPDGVLHAVFLDFPGPGRIGPETEADRLTVALLGRLPVTRPLSPRRILLRWHDAAAALASVTCPD